MMNKRLIIFATLVVMFLTASMPSMGEVIYLTNSNKFPAGEFNVSVTLEGTEKNISVELLEYPENITPLGFEKFTYNLSTKVAEISEGNESWDKNVGQANADGFGNFLSNKVKVNCGSICHAQSGISYGYGIPGPLVFTLENLFNIGDLEPNSDRGSSLAVHLIYRLEEGNCTFCTWISDGVTRCHHTLGHVVNAGADQMIDEGDILTIGLTFKDGFTKGSGGHTGGCSGEEGGGCMGGGSDGSHGGSDGDSDGGSTEPCPDGTHDDDSCGGDHSTGSEAMSDSSDSSHNVSDGGSTEPCSDGTHTDDSCGGDHSTGSGGMGGGSQGVKHGQCEPHNHAVTIEWGDGTENTLIEPAVSPLDITHTYDGIGIYTVNVTVVDEFGRAGTDSMQVVVVSLDTPIDPVSINSVVTVTATIPDGMISGGCPEGSHDTSTDDSCPTGEHPGPISELDWGDGFTDSTYISGNSAQFSHEYGSADIYTTTLRIVYNKGMEEVNLTARSVDYIVVYDPEGGFVTGGGWIDSPSGAYAADLNLVGRANFGFVSKYQKGATTPTGTTEFQFKIANMNFHSDDYQWLVIAGPNAKYKGTGSINGIDNYGFMLTATDSSISGGGSSDAFRIKIWDMNEEIVYDNEPLSDDDANPTTPISGGSISVKTNGN